jgi:hypothetical protein
VAGGEIGQLLDCRKSPVVWIDVMDSGTGWWFVICIALLGGGWLVPIFVEPKVKELGDNVTGETPLPFKLAVVGDP